MDIFEHLKQDHRHCADIMNQIVNTDPEDGGRQRQQLFSELKAVLTRHAFAEEDTFYSYLERFEEIDDLIVEAREDHEMIRALCSEIDALAPSSDAWMMRFEELKECVEDHVKQEETEIFDEARDLINGSAAEELEQRMRWEEQRGAPSL